MNRSEKNNNSTTPRTTRQETSAKLIPDRSSHFHTFCDDALGDHDAVALVGLLKKGEVSRRELADAAIARAEQAEPKISAIELPTFAIAQRNADRIKPGFFNGIPSFLKDNRPMAGLPTRHGSAALPGRLEKKNDPYTDQYLKLGFNILGKSTLPEFGFNATTEPTYRPPTRNPWNMQYSSGASSGGSAALVASGVVPIAHANDGGGSIRIPAACCGLVGLKPTRGRHIDSLQAKALPINIVSEGVVTRSVRDTAYFHAEMEKHYSNRKLPEIGLVTRPNKQRLRIAFAIDSITGHATDQATRATVEQTARLLEDLGHRVSEIPIPIKASFIEDFTLYWSFLAFLTHLSGKLIFDPQFDPMHMDDLSKGLVNRYKKNVLKTPFFLNRLRKTRVAYQQLFKQYDLVLTPVLAHTTAPLGHISPDVPFDELMSRLTHYVGFTPLANVSGAPAISLPMGHNTENLPISVQFLANMGMDKTLLEIAYELEEAQPWRLIHAPARA
ncbi:amidase [Oleiphilus messinensis]|uniref:Amidase n=1 Tax=Oleiphilus messinensis TaxID=141451 RepID=A0A1Y0IHQ2_9GAMM|nr:amidase [Oleiphilus messinensis]ARU59085.1 amidase [Oleiphilus messinensis]